MADSPQHNQRPRRGRPFEKGQSGNAAGKPKGTRHATTILAEKLMADDAEAVVRAVIEKARDGDMTAARLILDRIAPARRDSPVTIALPKLERPADAQAASAIVLAAVASGDLTPGEAGDVFKLIEGFVRTIEVTEIEGRLAKLEAEMRGEDTL